MRATRLLLSLIVTLAALLLLAVPLAALTNDSVAFFRESVSGASVCVIQVDLNDPTVRIDVGLPARGIAHSESFAAFMKRHTPLAAVTGVYFDLRTLRPTGTIVTGGKTVHVSHIGTAVCFTPGNRVTFVDAKPGESCDLSTAECGFRTGPRLLAGGQYALNPRAEGFRHPGLYGARTRMALGVTSHNKLLLVLVRTPVTFSRLATVMKALGATDAVCLDGGTSSAMYYMGTIIKSPGRQLTNVVEVLRRTRFDTTASPASANSTTPNGGLLSASGVPGSAVPARFDTTASPASANSTTPNGGLLSASGVPGSAVRARFDTTASPASANSTTPNGGLLSASGSRFDTTASPGLLSAYGVSAPGEADNSMAAAVQTGTVVIAVSAPREWQPPLVVHAGRLVALGQSLDYEPAAMLSDPIKLRLSKGLHTLFPVNRT